MDQLDKAALRGACDQLGLNPDGVLAAVEANRKSLEYRAAHPSKARDLSKPRRAVVTADAPKAK